MTQRESDALDLVKPAIQSFLPTTLILSLAWGIWISGRFSPVLGTQVRSSLLWIPDVLGILWLVFDLPYLLRLWKSVFSERGSAALVQIAGRYRPWRALRPLAAIWWSTHFLMGATLVGSFEH